MKTKSKIFMILSATVSLVLYQNCNSSMKANSDHWLGSSLNNAAQQSLFQCQPDQDPSPKSAQKLTKLELTRSINFLLSSLSTSDQSQIQTALLPHISSIPDDQVQKFDSDDTLLNSSHVSAYFSLARELSKEISKNNTRLQAFMGTCASLSNLTDNCISSFLSTKGTLILRRPIEADEITSFQDLVKNFSSDQAQWLLTRLFMHPHFLFHIENRGTNEKSDLLKISAFELASRISFHLLKQTPDQTLLDKAQNGSLLNPSVMTTEIDRLVSTYPQLVGDSLDRFFEGWLSYKNIAHPITGQTPEEIAFSEGAQLSRDSLINEIKNMTRHYTENQGSFDDLFLSPYSFASDDDLAQLYGVSKWSGQKDDLIPFPAGERSGLLTRAAFLVSGNTHTNPIIRGLMIRREFLCEEIPNPPSNIANMVRDPLPDPNASTRERFHEQTNTPACIGCHVYINPLGFAMESYDAFGRFRLAEKIYDESGTLVNQIPVDPVIEPLVTQDDNRTVASTTEFNQILAESGKARGCMVESFFRYTYKKIPDRKNDGCALAAMDTQATEKSGLKNMFIYAPLSEAFLKRKID